MFRNFLNFVVILLYNANNNNNFVIILLCIPHFPYNFIVTRHYYLWLLYPTLNIASNVLHATSKCIILYRPTGAFISGGSFLTHPMCSLIMISEIELLGTKEGLCTPQAYLVVCCSPT